MNDTELALLKIIADMGETPDGAYNIRANGGLHSRHVTENIDIRTKTDRPGIDIIIKPGTTGETVHIPVLISETGLSDLVYNDFLIGDNADVTIIAGCGIHNCGEEESRHDGIHTFFVGKNARVKYIEKHYGSGKGTGEKNMNPTTVVHVAEDGYMEMETTQIEEIINRLTDYGLLDDDKYSQSKSAYYDRSNISYKNIRQKL
ncbi:MAG: RecX family transcriptional regulator, partial [Clostridia bacterium]|nr:RecX family transcriptional regulator [Clostridia bacterium]